MSPDASSGARRPFEMAYDGAFAFPFSPRHLWDDLERFERYDRWWGWLRDLDVDGDGLEAGTVLRGVVIPPVPYRMGVVVRLVDCRPPERVDAEVDGDLRGPARLRLERAGDGSTVRVAWRLEMRKPTMRAAARVMYPVLRWGHDRVVAATVQGYRRHLLERSG